MNVVGSGDSSRTFVPKIMASDIPPCSHIILIRRMYELLPYEFPFHHAIHLQLFKLKVYGFFQIHLSCVYLYIIRMIYLFSLLVSWTKDGREIQDTGRFRFHSDGNTFTFEIPAALATDSGQYAATARSSRGSTQWAFTLHVAVSLSPCADIDVVQLIRSMQVNIWVT